MELPGNAEGRRITDVVGVRFERSAENRDAGADQRSTGNVFGDVDHPGPQPHIDVIDLTEETESLIRPELTRSSHEGPDVLGQAPAAEANARVQESAADPFVIADRVRQFLTGLVAQVGEFRGKSLEGRLAQLELEGLAALDQRRMVDELADRLMSGYPLRWIEITVRKFILTDAEWVAVTVRRLKAEG